jgi:hypothetical protein
MPVKEPPMPTEAEWIPDTVWMICSYRNSKSDPSVVQTHSQLIHRPYKIQMFIKVMFV